MANAAMEVFVEANYGYLNGNVEAMGKILRKFNETFEDVKALRQQVWTLLCALCCGLHPPYGPQARWKELVIGFWMQVNDCQAALLDGLKEQNIRQMWIRKKENEYILATLDKLDMLRETPLGE
jgi:hypothetical protein